jgi:hypothetical protein
MLASALARTNILKRLLFIHPITGMDVYKPLCPVHLIFLRRHTTRLHHAYSVQHAPGAELK